MPPIEDLIPTATFLTDRQITAALNASYLIERGTWDPGQIRHASYTLRLGQRVEIFRASQQRPEDTKEFAIIALTADRPSIELRPGDTALLYSLENLKLPDSVLGLAVARGLLFAEALAPENTYVDPGFNGPLYTTVTNVSNRIVTLNYLAPICRLFFFKLSEPVEEPYRTGSALGIAQQLRSVRAVPLGTSEQCAKALDQELLRSISEMPFCGIHLAELLQRHTNQRRLDLSRLSTIIVAWPILLTVVNTVPSVREIVGPFFGNVLASLVAGGLLLVAPRIARRFGWQ